MTRFPKKILYIQHASSLGGSCMSLLYTMQGLDETRYQPILALANDSKPVIDFYKAANEAGIKPIIGIDAYVADGVITERGLHCFQPAKRLQKPVEWPYEQTGKAWTITEQFMPGPDPAGLSQIQTTYSKGEDWGETGWTADDINNLKVRSWGNRQGGGGGCTWWIDWIPVTVSYDQTKGTIISSEILFTDFPEEDNPLDWGMLTWRSSQYAGLSVNWIGRATAGRLPS